jgi:hypothetical protein
MVRRQVPFDDLALLLLRRGMKNRSQLAPRLAEDGLAPPLGHQYDVVLSVTSQVVRFYYYVICPLCETKRRGRQAAALVLGLAFAFLLEKTEAVVGAVGKWESRGLGEISKGVWERGETCFWFSPASTLPPFPRRSVGFASVSFSPVLL